MPATTPVVQANPKRRRRRNPTVKANPKRRRRRRNPMSQTSSALAQTFGGAGLGALLVGVTKYVTQGKTWSATPGKRALIYGAGAFLAAVGGSVAAPRSTGVVAGVAGAFAGATALNVVDHFNKGTTKTVEAKKEPAKKDTTKTTTAAADNYERAPVGMGGVVPNRRLAANMKVVSDSQLKAILAGARARR